MTFTIQAGCRADATAVVRRLESERTGYGVAFRSLFEKAVRAIASDPCFYPRTEDGPEELGVREYFIERFEYRLLYRIDGEHVVFLALVHARNRPDSWVRRIAD
jgi:hypothetical protein